MEKLLIARYLLDCLDSLKYDLISLVGETVKYSFEDLAVLWDDINIAIQSYDRTK